MFRIRGRDLVGRAAQGTGLRPPGGWWTAVAVAVAAFVVAGPVSPRIAGASDGPQELVAKRTATSETFRNPDGTFTTSAYAAPIHYLDASGSWQKIDSTLDPSPLAGYAWTNRANAFHVHFKDRLGASYLRFAVDGRAITLSLQGALEAKAAAHGAQLRYAGALPDVSLDYAVRADGLEETLGVHDDPAARPAVRARGATRCRRGRQGRNREREARREADGLDLLGRPVGRRRLAARPDPRLPGAARSDDHAATGQPDRQLHHHLRLVHRHGDTALDRRRRHRRVARARPVRPLEHSSGRDRDGRQPGALERLDLMRLRRHRRL